MVMSYSCLPLRCYRSLLDAPPVNCEPCRILRLARKYVNTIDRHLFGNMSIPLTDTFSFFDRHLFSPFSMPSFMVLALGRESSALACGGFGFLFSWFLFEVF